MLIESVLATFEMEEILFELKEHSAGLNCGIWDYSASFVNKFGISDILAFRLSSYFCESSEPKPDHCNRVNRTYLMYLIIFKISAFYIVLLMFLKKSASPPGHRQAFLLPDRSKYVNMEKRFLRSYMDLLVQTCHRRGALATGGMAALLLPQDPLSDSHQRVLATVSRWEHCCKCEENLNLPTTIPFCNVVSQVTRQRHRFNLDKKNVLLSSLDFAMQFGIKRLKVSIRSEKVKCNLRKIFYGRVLSLSIQLCQGFSAKTLLHEYDFSFHISLLIQIHLKIYYFVAEKVKNFALSSTLWVTTGFYNELPSVTLQITTK